MLRDIFGYRPVQTIFLFVVLAGSAQFVTAPWWEGTMLQVRPELPDPSGKIVDPPKYRAEVKQQVAQVDLDQAASKAGESETPDPPSGDRAKTVPFCDVGDDKAAGDGDNASNCRASLLPDPKDIGLLKVIRKLDESLGEPPTELERPCLEWTPTALTLGHEPLCARRPMDDFFDRLRRVALKQTHRPVRISQFGDSLIAGDAFTAELRRLLGDQFGDGGFGYLHVGQASAHLGSRNLTIDMPSGWSIYSMIRKPRADVKFGYGGVSFRAYGTPSLGVYPADSGHGTTFDRVGILYHRLEGNPSVEVKVDGDSRVVDLSGPPNRNAVTWLEVGPGSHDLRVSGFDRSAYHYALLLENSGPGVVVDNLGLSNGRAPRLRFIDDRQWRGQIRKRHPDLMSFAYGVNSASEYKPSDAWLKKYLRQYTEVLKTARMPEEGINCLVIGLLTHGKLVNGRVRIYGSVKPLLRYQRRAARRAKCGFWSGFDAIGGREGTERWYRSRPRLLISDLAHPTRAGYKKLANLFYSSLIAEFRNYLEERIRRASVPKLEDDDSPPDRPLPFADDNRAASDDD